MRQGACVSEGGKVNDYRDLIKELHQTIPDDPDRQFNAAIALGKDHDLGSRPQIVAELIKALGPGHQALTRAHAAESLGDLRDPQAIPALIIALGDSYRLVRSYAARAIGKMDCIEASAGIDPLIQVLQLDEFFGARAEAAEALGKIFKSCKEKNFADDKLLKRAERAVGQHEREELKQLDGRFQRVINETRQSMNKIGSAILGLSDDDKARIRAAMSSQIEQLAALGKDVLTRMA
jgi:hypothetical protein